MSTRIEAVDRALEQMFRGVLHSAGNDDPPQLQEVRVTYDEMRNCLRIRGRFMRGGREWNSETEVLGHELHHRERPTRSGRFIYDAGVLWSRLYEDHYVGRMEEVGWRAAREADMAGHHMLAEDLREQSRRTAEHARQYHIGLDRGRPISDYSPTWFSFDELGELPREITATEMLQQQRQSERAHRRMAAHMERQIMAAVAPAQSSTVADTNAGPITIATLAAAMRALETNSVTREWRNAFLQSAHEFEMWFNTAPAPEVGSPEAQARGIELLKESLTPAQRQSYEVDRHFEVRGSDTGTRYRIKHGRQMNIDVLDANGNRVHGICFLPVGGLVAGDCMLAQKLALELEETEALKVANRFS